MPQELTGGIAVEGLAQLNRTFKHAPKDVRLAYRKELRTVANPTRETAERFALERIRRVRFSPKWAKFRTGVTINMVYVAPRQRGVKTRGRERFRRGSAQIPGGRDFGTLLAKRASQPARRANEGQVEQQFSDMLDRLVHKWDSEGHRASGVRR